MQAWKLVLVSFTWLELIGSARAQVNEEWVARFSGLGNGDQGKALALDSSGNIYVTGLTCLASPCMAIAYGTVKYDTDGNEVWSAQYSEPRSHNAAVAIAVDGDGNIYVTGESERAPGLYDYATVKYDADGTELWVARYAGLGAFSNNSATALRLDESGNAYVTGWSEGTRSGDYDFATIKYDKDGNEIWIARYDGPAHGADGANAMEVDGAGNVYVTGFTTGAQTGLDYATIKYNADGEQQWVSVYDGPSSGRDEAIGIALGGAERVYVTGNSEGNWTTIAYDSEGNESWVIREEAPSSPAAITIDVAGNIVTTGWGYRSFFRDFLTIEYTPDGSQRWASRHSSEDPSDGARAIATDDQGNVYVTGVWGIAPNRYMTIKYDAEGNEQWFITYDSGSQSGYNAGEAIALDGKGNVFVTGRSDNPPVNFGDYATIKYSQE